MLFKITNIFWQYLAKIRIYFLCILLMQDVYSTFTSLVTDRIFSGGNTNDMLNSFRKHALL